MQLLGIKELEDKKLYKANQIVINGTPKIFFVKEDPGCFHRDILSAILIENRLRYSTVEIFTGKGPALNGEGYAVKGMGGAILLGEKHVLLFGNSFEYGIDISDKHAENLREEELPDWEFTVTHIPKG